MNIHQDLSKGGLIGALAGALSSSKLYAKNDTPVEKAVKTGTSAGVGYLLGAFIEKFFRKTLIR